MLKSFIKGIWVDADKEEEITRQYIEMMDTKTPSQEQLIGNLSGGRAVVTAALRGGAGRQDKGGEAHRQKPHVEF